MTAAPFEHLLPPLSTAEFAALRDDIASNGQHVPIAVTRDGRIIDGHHRMRVCQELGLEPRVTEVDHEWPEAAAIGLNLNRRNLTADQRAGLRTEQQRVAAEMKAAGLTQDRIGGALGVDRSTVGKWLDGSNVNGHKASDNRTKVPPKQRPAMAARIDDGEPVAQVAADFGITPRRVGQIDAKERAKAAETAARQADVATVHADAEGDGWKMLSGDYRDRLLDIPDGSVDLIVTDPPYPEEFIGLYDDLGQQAARVLRPQGVAVVLTGKIFLPDVMERLGRHLDYAWVYCQPLPGSQSRILARQVLQSWKPWLAYSNGPWPSGRVDWHPDMLEPGARMKDRYRWEQNPDPAKLLINDLCPEGGVVLDPYAGTGAYGTAALSQGRSFIGCELDSDRFAGAVDRLTDVAR